MSDLRAQKHIALYLPSMGGGGAERVMVMLANGFADRGHRVDLVLVRAEGPNLSAVSDQVRIIDLHKKRVISSIAALTAYIKRDHPDVMISAMAHSNIAALTAVMMSKAKTQTIVAEHTSIAFSGTRSYIVHVLRKFLYKKADRIVCVSKGIEDKISQSIPLRPGQICTIYNPLDVRYIRARADEPLDTIRLVGPDSQFILAVGRLTAAKDYPTLLKSFAIIRAQREIKLVILGEGDEREHLENMVDELGISHDVIFAGFQENPFAWMARCDVYVMSSAWEGLPGALLEAMACGAKIVSTDCPTGPNEILEGGKWGRLVPVGNAPELAIAITEALDDATPPSDARRRADDFRMGKAIDRYIDAIYHNI